MINVNQITSQLAKMPDQMLQKYAAMHKSDPYILALAVGESNRRKEMRAGAQMQAPQQPKVVDQEVQGMAAAMPEDTGIARIPAGEMNFADGGIVAFADGGGVERYQFGGSTSAIDRILQKSPYERTPEDNALLAQAGYNVQSRSLGPDSGVASANTFLQGIGPRMRDYFTGGASRMTDEELAAHPAVGGVATERVLRGLGMKQSTAPLGPQASYSNEGRREPGLFAAAPVPAPAATDKPAPKVDTTQRTAAPGTGAGAPALPTAAAGLPSLNVGKLTEDALAAAAKAPNPFAGQVEEIGKQKVAAKEEEAKGLEAIQKQFADVYKGRKERLDKSEAELSTRKDQNFGLALLQAGAAMMSTPGSIGTAIGRGIDTGSKQYVAGMDKLNAAKEKLADARDRLEELEAQRGELSAREMLKVRSEIKTLGVSAKEDMLKSNMQMYNVNRETAMKMVDNQIKVGIAQLEQAGANARTNAQIAAQAIPAEMRGAMMLGEGKTDAEKIESGMRRLQEIQADKSGMSAVKLLTETNAKREAAGQPPITMQELLMSARQYTALMYPKVGENQPTRERPGP